MRTTADVQPHMTQLTLVKLLHTDVAVRYTRDRRDNFDSWLPAWLARCNKVIFARLYVAGVLTTLARWWRR